MKKHLLIVGIILLFILSSVSPLTFGSNIESTVDIDPLQDYYGSYSLEEIPESIRPIISKEEENLDIPKMMNVVNVMDSPESLDGLMDSAWPMYCYDVRHTGRSPYSTVNTWDEIWRFKTHGSAGAGPAINEDGIIYIGSHDLRAVYPNGTLKWSFNMNGWCQGNAPAIGENGTIYIGTVYGSPSYLYAFYPDGTLKWKYSVGGAYSLFSSPAIDDDGAIYFGSGGDYPPTGYIKALYPNKTLKWEYNTNHIVYSSPAIGNDGTIYCGSHDTNLYALYPNNGTLKWKYKTGGWIRTSPSIADDGTIYVVSLDNHLHAVNPNGTLKWKTNMGEGGTSPTIGHDGTIYAGYETLHAINPINGSVKWKFNVGGTMRGGTPCNTIDGTIYVGTSDGGKLIAINPDGTEKWRKPIGTCESPPAIGEDGTVYIGSNNDYLFAFGIGLLEADANGPYYGLLHEPVQFEGYSRGGYSPHSYHWDFGDTFTSDEQNPTHIYINPGNYTVTLIVTDDTGNTSDDTTWAWIQDGNSPPNTPVIDGETNGREDTNYPYTFTTSDPEGLQILYYIEWGDGSNTGWIGPYASGDSIIISHKWDNQGNYTIKAKAKDPYGDEGPWGELEVNMPRNKNMMSSLFLKLLERFPIFEEVLLWLINPVR